MPEISTGALALDSISPSGTGINSSSAALASKGAVFGSLLQNIQQQPVEPIQSETGDEAGNEALNDVIGLLKEVQSLLQEDPAAEEAVSSILENGQSLKDLIKDLEEEGTGQLDEAVFSQLQVNLADLLTEIKDAWQTADEPSKEMSELSSKIDEWIKTSDTQQSSKAANLLQQVHMVPSQQVQVPAPLQDRIEQVLKEIEAAMKQAETGTDLAKVSPKLLKLLEEWSALTKQTAQLADGQKVSASMLPKEMSDTWRALADTYDKRTTMTGKQYYNGEAKVTSGDVLKWIGNALQNGKSGQGKEEIAVNPISSATELNIQSSPNGQIVQIMPMSKTEQFQIHLSAQPNSQQQNTEFTSQFQRIVDTSRFLQTGSMNRQLVINLNPGNLGDIMIKMQRVDGELMVKLLVNSPEAKRLLESNLTQLRNMFSPHQVTVEKQEAVIATAPGSEQQAAREQQKEQQSRQQQSKQQQQDHQEDSAFSEFLMNAKV